jgi:hypothetical protein
MRMLLLALSIPTTGATALLEGAGRTMAAQ